MKPHDKKPDFYLTGFARSPERGDDWQKVRACWVQNKIVEKSETEYLLIKISPSVKCYSWGLEGREIEDVLLLRLHSDTVIDPISEWPFSVFVFGLLDDSALTRLASVDYIHQGIKRTKLEKELGVRIRTNLSLQAYCELFENYEDAEAVVGVKPEYPTMVRKPKDIEDAKKSFHSIFKSGDFEPFQENIQKRMLVFCDRFLDKSHFDAIKQAAAEIGESTAFVSLTSRYKAIKKKNFYERVATKNDLPISDSENFFKRNFEDLGHYLIDLNFHTYEDLDEREYPLDAPLSVLEYTLYSTRGTWGVMLEEDYALVGGTHKFMDSLKSYSPRIEKEAEEYLPFMREALNTYADRDVVRVWLPSVIEHVYGSQSDTILDATGITALLNL